MVGVDQVHRTQPVAVHAARERLQHIAHARVVRVQLDLLGLGLGLELGLG